MSIELAVTLDLLMWVTVLVVVVYAAYRALAWVVGVLLDYKTWND